MIERLRVIHVVKFFDKTKNFLSGPHQVWSFNDNITAIAAFKLVVVAAALDDGVAVVAVITDIDDIIVVVIVVELLWFWRGSNKGQEDG